jgi:hypothetical protein
MTSETGKVTAVTATAVTAVTATAVTATAAGRRLELVADPPGELRVALADGARALHVAGDLRASRQSFERAYRLAAHAGDAPAMALAALGLAGLWVHERRTVAGAVMLEERLAHAASRLDARYPLALRIRVRLAGEDDYVRGEHAAILAVLGEARAAADPVALAEALNIAHHCLLGPDHIQLRGQLAAELTKVSVRTQRRSDLLMGLLWQTVDSYSAGDPHAGRLLTELRDHLREGQHLAVCFVVSAIEVMLAIRAGRLQDAESLACRQLVTIRWYQGRLVELLPMLRDRAHSPVLSAVDDSVAAALAVAAALDGDRRTAASSLAALCGTELGRLLRSSSWLVTMNGIVEAACLLQDAVVAGRAYQLLRPYADVPMVGSLGVTCFGSAQHSLGVASLTSGQLDRAVDHLRAAVQHNLALAHWPAVVSSRRRLVCRRRPRRSRRSRTRPGQKDQGRPRTAGESAGSGGWLGASAACSSTTASAWSTWPC